MTTNSERRAYATALALRVSRALGLAKAPVCHRITRARGWGHRAYFSVPGWAFKGSPAYRDYYIAHEVCHATGNNTHDALFKADEAKAMKAIGLQLQFEKAHDDYPIVIRNAAGEPVASEWGDPIIPSVEVLTK
jgi:hypothetical protein